MDHLGASTQSNGKKVTTQTMMMIFTFYKEGSFLLSLEKRLHFFFSLLSVLDESWVLVKWQVVQCYGVRHVVMSLHACQSNKEQIWFSFLKLGSFGRSSCVIQFSPLHFTSI